MWLLVGILYRDFGGCSILWETIHRRALGSGQESAESLASALINSAFVLV